MDRSDGDGAGVSGGFLHLDSCKFVRMARRSAVCPGRTPPRGKGWGAARCRRGTRKVLANTGKIRAGVAAASGLEKTALCLLSWGFIRGSTPVGFEHPATPRHSPPAASTDGTSWALGGAQRMHPQPVWCTASLTAQVTANGVVGVGSQHADPRRFKDFPTPGITGGREGGRESERVRGSRHTLPEDANIAPRRRPMNISHQFVPRSCSLERIGQVRDSSAPK